MMATTHDSLTGGGGGGVPNKLTKARGRVVKPILKKLSHSEKNSLDLDRGWEEQPRHGWPETRDLGSAGRSVREFSVSFGDGAADGGVGGLAGPGGGTSSSSRKLQHARTASGTSHVSVGTSGSGGGPRGGSFVHPFQQTPRTSTPPLSYANSMASLDMSRDYSPTITENDDEQLEFQTTFSSPTGPSLSHHLQHHHTRSSTFSPPASLRRPSFASQRTSSLTDVSSATPQLRVNTGRTSSTAATSRLAHGSLVTSSHSELPLQHVNQALNNLDSPTGSLKNGLSGHGSSYATAASNSQLASPTSPSSSVAAMSPFEGAGFPRLRSRSEVDTITRAQHIREARQKFEERERAKEEKYDREQIRKRERRDAKEAARIEKEAAQMMKSLTPMGVSGGGGGGGGSSSGTQPGAHAGAGAGAVGVGVSVGARKSGEITGPRPTASRKSTATSLLTTGSVLGGGGSGTTGVSGNLTAGSSRHDISSASGFGLGSIGVGGTSAILGNGAGRASRKNSGSGGMGMNFANSADPEKQLDFWSSKYESVPGQSLPSFVPNAEGVQANQPQPRRVRTAKKKTQGYWHGFVFWLRTKLLRMGAR